MHRKIAVSYGNNPDVLVVGAGAAGLMAARQLFHAGLKVIVLEAQNRSKGRVMTKYRGIAPFPVECRAESFHTADDALVQNLMKRYKLNMALMPGKGWSQVKGGIVANADELDPIHLLKDTARNYLLEHDDMRAEDFLDTEAGLEVLRFTCRTRRFFKQALYNDYAHSGDLTLSGLIEPDASGYGENYKVKEGLATLLRHMEKGLDIRLCHEVQSIEWQPGFVKMETQQGEFFASKAVITLPLGVLQKRAEQLFQSRLPDPTMNAIQKLRVGNAIKMIIAFTHQRWPDTMDILSLERDTQLWWNPGMGHNYHNDPHILTNLISGTPADYYSGVARHDPQEAIWAAVEQLGDILDEPTLTHHIDWGRTHVYASANDPHILTGYSYTGKGGDRELREILSEPVADTLYFAGEAVGAGRDEPGKVASVHGAMISGAYAAHRIIEGWKE